MTPEVRASQTVNTASRDAARKVRWRRSLTSITIAYLGILGVLVACETRLIYPAPRFPEGDWNPRFDHEEATFKSADGTQLHGWLVSHPGAERWILFFHGNGEHVPYAAESLVEASRRLKANFFVFDYRGYGRSAGTPYEAGVLADGEAALDWIAQRSGKAPSEIVLYGRSLGGAVAIHVAALKGARAVVVERSFARLTDVAAHHFWWLPVRWAMRNRYPCAEWLQNYHGPLLISHGTRDRVVPYPLGRQLFDAAPSRQKEFVTLEGVGHNDPNPEAYWGALERFLGQ